ncbi:hypothetical protein ACFE04_014054 [Oxalis oulophora]
MAPTKSSILQVSLSFFLLILLLVSVLAHPMCSSNLKTTTSSWKTNRQLLSISSTTKFDPRQSSTSPYAKAKRKSTGSLDRQFRGAAHEVPSGPNPESNK